MSPSSYRETLEPSFDAPVEITDEMARWRAREVKYIAGKWATLLKEIPRFAIEEFKATADGPANPYSRSVIRLPVKATEQKIPVAVVSNTYQLAQHAEVVEMCLNGIRAHDIDPSELGSSTTRTCMDRMRFKAALKAAINAGSCMRCAREPSCR